MADGISAITNIEQTQGEQRPLGWKSLSSDSYVKIGIIGALFVYLFRVEIYRLLGIWATDSSWSHGFLIPLFSLYLLNQRKQEILELHHKSNYWGLVLLILCLMFYPINIVQFKVGYARQLIMLPTLGAIVLFLGGRQLLRYTWLPILYLIFAIPIPDRLYKAITIPMRHWAAQVAVIVLNLVKDIEATASGVIIDIVYKGQKFEPPLDVAEACSGMRLLMAFVALGVAMAYLHYRPAWQRLILLLSTIPIALLCNIIRVTVTGLIYILIDPKYAQGIYHDMLGLATLPLAFGFYELLAWFMASLFVDESDEPKAAIIRRQDKKL